MNNNISNKFNEIQRQPFVTYGLLALTVIMFLLMTFNGGSENPLTLWRFGAKINELIVLGDWWRLITPMFLHIGFTHLLFNGLIIYFLGIQLEMVIGHVRFFLLYILSGVLGNAASFALTTAISAGASTAVFGMFAATIVLAKLYPNHMGIQNLSRNYLTLIIINIVFGFFSATVDNAGHIGGLIGGYLMMYILSSPNAANNPQKKRILYAALYVMVLAVLIIIGVIRTVNRSF